MSVAGDTNDLQRGTPYHVTHTKMHVMLPTLLTNKMTDACENITSPQLRWLAVIIQLDPAGPLSN